MGRILPVITFTLTALIAVIVLAVLHPEGPLSDRPIYLQGQTLPDGRGVDPDVVAQLAVANSATPRPERQHLVLQFSTRLTAEERRAVERTGIRLLGYVHENAYIAGLPTRTSQAILTDLENFDPPLRRVVALNSSHKLRNSLTLDTDGSDQILVKFYEDTPLEEQRAIITGVLPSGASPTEPRANVWQINADLPRANALANDDAVQWIEKVLPLVNDLSDARATIGFQPPSSSTTGDGVTLAQWEISTPVDHIDYRDLVVPTPDPAPNGNDHHANLVAGILIGDGTGDATQRGMAPDARLISYSTNTAGWWADQFGDATNRGATISNHSFGSNDFYFQHNGNSLDPDPYYYTLLGGFYDSVVSGRTESGAEAGFPQRVLVVTSAGNLGTWPSTVAYAPQWGTARAGNSPKNTVVVGNIATDTSGITGKWPTWNSGRGPSLDGRFVPTLTAPGSKRSATANSDDHGITSTGKPATPAQARYEAWTGTSFSAPMVAGAAALVSEVIADSCSVEPEPSTLRAVLVNTASDLGDASQFALPMNDIVQKIHPSIDGTFPAGTDQLVPAANIGLTSGSHPGPDNIFGFGLLNTSVALDRAAQFVTGEIEQGWIEYRVEVPSAGYLTVTLAWDDPPHPLNAGGSVDHGILQNDLDLELVSPSGKRHLPWVVDPEDPNGPAEQPSYGPQWLFFLPDSARDHRNTIEHAHTEVSPGEVGAWTIRVRARLVGNGPQEFSVVSSAFGSSCGSLTDTRTIEDPFYPPEDLIDWILFWIGVLILLLLIIAAVAIITHDFTQTSERRDELTLLFAVLFFTTCALFFWWPACLAGVNPAHAVMFVILFFATMAVLIHLTYYLTAAVFLVLLTILFWLVC